MQNIVALECKNCGAENRIAVGDSDPEDEAVACWRCGAPLSTKGKLHARLAQEAAGIGADELRDDHVPLGGPPFGETT